MPSFWELPKDVREKIYQMHLVQKGAVTYARLKALCGCTEKDFKVKGRLDRIMPRILQVSRKLEREASHIFFGENTFVVAGPKELDKWIARLWPRHARHIRAIILREWAPGDNDTSKRYVPGDFKRLASVFRLEKMVLIVDEKKILERLLKESNSSFAWHPSLVAGPQMYLHMSRAGGMAGLRAMRGLQHVKFQSPMHRERGSIPGGFLETVVKREIMQSGDARALDQGLEGHFRFLDLPPELRNSVYALLLVQRGAMCPWPGEPTSIISVHHSKRASVPIPCSALGILCVNRQINREAHSLFYQHNDFVFANPMRLQHFVLSLGYERLECIRSMTFFYKKGAIAEGGLTTMDVTLSTLRLLKNLRKLRILIPIPTEVDQPTTHLTFSEILRQPEANPARLPGARTLLTFRNLTDIKVFPPITVEDYFSLSPEKAAAVLNMGQAFEHFSYGLRLAQTGGVCHELYDRKNWMEDMRWPALDTQTWVCGYAKGCVCRQNSGDEESKGDRALIRSCQL